MMNAYRISMSRVFFAVMLVALASSAMAQQRSPEGLFKRWDKNGDGKLSKEELNDGLVNFYGAKFEDNEWNDIFK